MDIYLDNGLYHVSSDDRQLILKEKKTMKNRKTKEEYTLYTNAKYFSNPSWMFVYLIRKKIFDSSATTFEQLRNDINNLERYAKSISSDLDKKWKEEKGGK